MRKLTVDEINEKLEAANLAVLNPAAWRDLFFKELMIQATFVMPYHPDYWINGTESPEKSTYRIIHSTKGAMFHIADNGDEVPEFMWPTLAVQVRVPCSLRTGLTNWCFLETAGGDMSQCSIEVENE